MADDQPDDGTPQRQLSPIGLYSHAAEVAERFPQMKGTPAQFKAMLMKQGVKPDELKWSGYDQALGGQKLVTRDQLAQHFRSKLSPVQETTLGARESRDLLRDPDDYNRHARSFTDAMGRPPRTPIELARWLDKQGGETKFGQYTLPGGKNYREVLMHLPNKSTMTINDIHSGALAMYGRPYAALTLDERETLNDVLENKYPNNVDYQSSHWDTPNVLAHLRMSDRALPGGRKALHLEELQSDWAQEGRKKGFQTPENSKRMDEIEARKRELSQQERALIGVPTPEKIARREAINQERQALIQEGSKLTGAIIPSAPYVDSTSKWLDLGLKRLLHEAATGGYDKVVVTPGEEQAKRYDLSKHVKAIHYFDDGHLEAQNHAGDRVINQHGVKEEDLPNLIGKEVTNRLLQAPYKGGGAHKFRSLADQDLHVGGEGMKAFYDKLLPQALEKLAKKHDPEAKIRQMRLGRGRHVDEIDRDMDALHERGDINTDPNLGREYERLMRERTKVKNNATQSTVHSLDITPRMRASILKGQPAYAAGGKIGKAAGGLIESYPTDKDKGQMPPAIERALAMSRGL